VAFGPTLLVLDGERPSSCAFAAYLDYVGHTHQSDAKAAYGNAAEDASGAARFILLTIDPFVKMPALDRMDVLLPKTLDVDERRLPLAIHDMLQSGNG
jgi:hypothetical protein